MVYEERYRGTRYHAVRAKGSDITWSKNRELADDEHDYELEDKFYESKYRSIEIVKHTPGGLSGYLIKRNPQHQELNLSFFDGETNLTDEVLWRQ